MRPRHANVCVSLGALVIIFPARTTCVIRASSAKSTVFARQHYPYHGQTSCCPASANRKTLPMKIPVRLEWLALACLSACAPLPVAAPSHPEVARPALQQTFATAAVDSAFVRGEIPSRAWWRTFGDAQLDSLEDAALRGNPSLAAAGARIERARQMVRLAGLESELRLNGEVSATRQHLSENGLFPPPLGGSTLSEGDMSVGASYALDWWGRNHALLQAALGDSRAAEAERGAAELLLTAQVADTYFAWQGVAARQKLARRSAEQRGAALRLADARVKRGIDTGLATRQLEVLLAQDRADIRDLESQGTILRDRLAALCGNGPDWAAVLMEPAPSSADGFPLPVILPLDALARRPDVAALRWHAEAAASRIDEARAEFYPNVDLRLLLGLQSLDLGTWLTAKSWYGSFGPALRLPLFNTRTLRANLSVRDAEYVEAVARYNQGLIGAASEVGDALTRLASLGARERLQREASIGAERALRLQTARFERGLSDRLPVFSEEIASLAQQARESSLQAERKRAMVSLFQALGGGFDGNEER